MISGFLTNSIRSLRSRIDHSIGRPLLYTFSARSGLIFFELVTGLMLARLLGAAGFGTYAYVMAWIGVLSVPAAAGFDRLIIREVAQRRAHLDWPTIKGLLHFATKMVLVCSIAIAAILCLLSGMISRSDADLRAGLMIGSALLPFLAYGRIRQAALQGLGSVVAGQLPESLIQPASFIVLVSVLYLGFGYPELGSDALVLQVCAAAISCMAGVLLLRLKTPDELEHATPHFERPRWIRQALPFVWLLAMNMALINLDTITLGLLGSSDDVGVYRVASQMAALVMFPLTAINLITAPRIASLYSAGDLKGLQATVTDGARLALSLGMVIAIVLVLAGRPVLRLFGSDFAAGYSSLVILVAGYLVNSAVGVAGYVLIMTKFETVAATAFTLAVVMNLVICNLLIPRIGIEGAAVGTAVSIGALGILMAVFARRRIGIDASAIFPRPHGGHD